ncbi:hypothetical protein SAMN05421505_12277 [Sinosporangium album]|uniref:HTH cro/C1-type domain-containing protein n=1 Tax=Sinosporangium album TaxID=504805 RepID=A0A1G8F6V4_9ACTN|nr:hypothetical protein [Sinosporangium album]SDH77825.1 hypothetical protein SAMN05421505_12277 [Sinosporangium album]
MSLAERLTRLFRVVVNPEDREPYSLREAAEAISARGTPITDAYLSQLRTGERKTLSLAKAMGIARFFGVPVEYLSVEDDTPEQAALVARVESQLDLLGAILRTGTQQIALRSAELSPEGRKKIARLIEETRSEEGLPARTDDR